MYSPQGVRDVVTLDEVWYDPRKLRIVDDGPRGWVLTDGRTRLKLFDNAEDARNGLRVARRYTRRGLVGRGNARPNAAEYVQEYWTGHSGLPWEPLTKLDTVNYEPTSVIAEDLDERGWSLRVANLEALTDDMNDALTLLSVAERHTRIGFIGRNNPRPNRYEYIMTYWE